MDTLCKYTTYQDDDAESKSDSKYDDSYDQKDSK